MTTTATTPTLHSTFPQGTLDSLVCQSVTQGRLMWSARSWLLQSYVSQPIHGSSPRQAKHTTLAKSKPESKPCWLPPTFQQKPGWKMWHSARRLDVHVTRPAHVSRGQAGTPITLSQTPTPLFHCTTQSTALRPMWRLTVTCVFMCPWQRPLRKLPFRFKCHQKDLFLLRNHSVFFEGPENSEHSYFLFPSVCQQPHDQILTVCSFSACTQARCFRVTPQVWTFFLN